VFCILIYIYQQLGRGGTWLRSWLRHCATRQKVAVSIPDGVNGTFHFLNPSGRTTALWSNKPLTEISSRNISWRVKTALPSSCSKCLEIWHPQHHAKLRASLGLYRDCFTFTFIMIWMKRNRSNIKRWVQAGWQQVSQERYSVSSTQWQNSSFYLHKCLLKID